MFRNPRLARSSQSTIRFLGIAAAVVLPMFAANVAYADVACGDQVCPTGYECKSYEVGAACPAIATDDGKPVECTTGTTTYHSCVPSACTTTAECGVGMVCHESTMSECPSGTAPACPPDIADCKADMAMPESTCTTTTRSQCTPTYLLPCVVDNDCGAGFACVEQESCWCSGSGGTATPGTGVTAPEPTSGSGTGSAAGVAATDVSTDLAMPTTSECGCAKTGTFACKLREIPCSTKDDCPTGLQCFENPNRGACTRSADGTTSCPQTGPEKVCQSPYQRLNGGAVDGVGESVTSGAPTTGTSSPGTSTPGTKDGDNAAVPPSNPSVTQDEVGGGGCAFASREQRSSSIAALFLALLVVSGMRKRSQK